jgi:predicted AlkP superfamily phosphohydrolase/phosphomutase
VNPSRREFHRLLAGGIAGAGGGFPLLSCGSKSIGSTTGKKVIVLGLDGLDPNIIQRLMEANRAPNFKKLASTGVFERLGTTMPALSPVAWSSFITGLTPGGHGIPDFIARNPYSYMPFFSIWETRDADRKLTLGDYEFALSGGGVHSLRHGRPFWSYLTERGIPSTVIKIPTNFPVEETASRAVSGMGTPDVADSFGVFTYYTSDRNERYPDLSGGEVIRVRVAQGAVDTQLPGPANTMRKTGPGAGERTNIPLKIHVDPASDVVRIDVQDQQVVLKQGEFSDWVKVRFELVPMVASVAGIARFLLKRAHPHLQLYVTPINIDPEDQAMPVTYPAEVGGEIARRIGPFWTKGLPSDTKAFDHQIFRDEDYVKQADLILKEQLALFNYEWSQFKSGFFYFYVSSTDQDTHMLWRNMDETHPMHKASDPRFAGYIHYLYEEMDKLVGQVLPAVDDNTLLIVCSDHGFAQFGRQFHLNSWLRQQGYLVLKPGAEKKEKTNVLDVDWTKTAAYGIGFNGLYLNRIGREEQGIVDPRKGEELAARISRELESITDSETGAKPVAKVYDKQSIYSGEMTFDMPDLLVGYTPGYRSSSDSVIGESSKIILDINPWAWGGDHSMATDLVPGSLFCSLPIQKQNPNILDLPVTILDYFGVEKPEEMVGKSLFQS